MAINATYLSQLGEYTMDIGRLLAFELDKANSSMAGKVLDTQDDQRRRGARQPVGDLRQLPDAVKEEPARDEAARHVDPNGEICQRE
jgi:hypothetical protein